MPLLRDGSKTQDPRLDRLVQFDERSRGYPIRALVGRKTPRSYTWRIGTDFLIDQGREGACVGFAVVNELQARPAESRFGGKDETDRFAVQEIYWPAQKTDPWEGGSYPGASPQYDGTSVLAGVKAAQRLGYFEEYRWSFGLEDLVIGIGRHGPAVLGLAWFDTNYEPGPDGFIRPEGNVVGGHAILARAVKIEWKNDRRLDMDDVDLDRSYVTVRNSWGVWGHKGSGDAYITLGHLSRWLAQQGEACFMVNRTSEVSS